ncbi:DUF2637 domain-containing protein, partial [Streptomyces sp. JJ36]|uniref:DUF2637 domain-containing protein n=1 Tax=Streptomyces sp. JJ36 TaxID=2736645 RepID=UPI001F17D3A6
MTRTHRILIGVVVTGAVVIAAIGFAGSYAAVRDLAERKGFGEFAPFFPIGIDAGIVVLLALDLLLTWIRIPFPLLRQTAWLLTAATIAFNGAAAWPDPLGVGMHAVIPVLFVVAVEAARHAIGRIADITADKHMEGVRVSRWLLAFPSTFRLWRRMKLWELRSYEQVIAMEQDRLVYEARLRARYGRSWKRKAPVEALMPLRLARYGVPLAETGPAGLAAAGIEAPALRSLTPHAGGSEGGAPGGPRPGPDRAEVRAAGRPALERAGGAGGSAEPGAAQAAGTADAARAGGTGSPVSAAGARSGPDASPEAAVATAAGQTSGTGGAPGASEDAGTGRTAGAAGAAGAGADGTRGAPQSPGWHTPAGTGRGAPGAAADTAAAAGDREPAATADAATAPPGARAAAAAPGQPAGNGSEAPSWDPAAAYPAGTADPAGPAAAVPGRPEVAAAAGPG